MKKNNLNDLIKFNEEKSNNFLKYLETDHEKAREMIKNKKTNKYYNEVHIYKEYFPLSSIKHIIKFIVFERNNEELFLKEKTEILPDGYSVIILFNLDLLNKTILRKDFDNWIFLNTGNICFQNACFNFDGDVSFNYTHFINDANVSFNNTQFNNKGMVDFSNAKFNNNDDIFFDYTKFNNNDFILFCETIFGSIDSTNIIDLYFRNIEINKKFLFYEIKGNSYIFFENIELLNKNACIEFQRIHLDQLNNREIIINNCNLKKCMFTELNWNSFNFIGQNWGSGYRIKSIEENKINIKKLKNKEKIKKIIQLKEKYCSLKAMFKKNENYNMIVKFHASEIAMQRKTKKGPFKFICWEFLYCISSYYGTIWWLPLFWYLVLIMVLSVGSYSFINNLNNIFLSNLTEIERLTLLFKYFIYNALFINPKNILMLNVNNFSSYLFLIISKIHQLLSASLLIMAGFIIKRKFKS